jgi:hypothetical protein
MVRGGRFIVRLSFDLIPKYAAQVGTIDAEMVGSTLRACAVIAC